MSPTAVLDTNVLVAGIRSQQGASWHVLNLVRQDAVQIHVTVPLVLEYKEALLRHRDVPGWTRRETLAFVGALVEKSYCHRVYYLWRGHAADPDDDHVLEAAVTADVSFLVTFNTKDLKTAHQFGIEVLTPGEFLHKIDR